MRNEYVNISCLEHCVTSANIKDNVLHTDMAESQAEEKEIFFKQKKTKLLLICYDPNLEERDYLTRSL